MNQQAVDIVVAGAVRTLTAHKPLRFQHLSEW